MNADDLLRESSRGNCAIVHELLEGGSTHPKRVTGFLICEPFTARTIVHNPKLTRPKPVAQQWIT